MNQNFLINEMEWSYRQAELAKKLELKRQLKEAKNLARLEFYANQGKSGTDYSETINKNNQKIGKETLGWN